MRPHKVAVAQNFSSNNRSLLKGSKECGCYYCCKVFSPSLIEDWLEEEVGDTALCPFCGIDAVIGDKSGKEFMEQAFLEKLREYWFGRTE